MNDSQMEDFECVALKRTRDTVMDLYMFIEPSGVRKTVTEYWGQRVRVL